MGILSSTGQLPRAAVPKWISQEKIVINGMRKSKYTPQAMAASEPMSDSLNVLVSNEQDPLIRPNLNAVNTRSMAYKGHREMSIVVAPLSPSKIP